MSAGSKVVSYEPSLTNYSYVTWYIGMTFIVPAGIDRLDQVDVPLIRNGASGTITLSIYATSGGKPAGGALVSAYKAASDISSSGSTWYAWTFSPLTVTPTATYAIVICSNSIGWWRYSSASYGAGQGYYNYSGSSWVDYSRDFAFKVYGYTGAPAVVVPTVTTTTPATNILDTSFTAAGNVTSDGGGTITERGICYKTSTGPTTADSKVIVSGSTGAYSGSITSLIASTTYHTKAYAINSAGTSYGAEVDTATITSPTVTTAATSGPTLTTIGVGGNMTANGGGTISEKGVCYSSENSTPTIADSKKTHSGTATGAWTDTVSDLLPGTIYYFRAYATNAVGTSYGSVVTGTTSTAPNTTAPEIYSTIDTNLNDGNIRIYTTADDESHFMLELNNVLYIADRNYVHQVEDLRGTQTYSPFALDIPRKQRITCLGRNKTDLLIGTKVDNQVNESGLYVWNGWSVSFTATDNVKESGVNAFLDVDNFVLASIGLNGRLYLYKDGVFQLYKTIPGDYSPTKTCTVHPYATANLGGLPLFGLSNAEGNPVKEGVYSFGSRISGYPFILNMEYPISERDGSEFLMSGIEIGAIVVIGNNLYISWKDDIGSYGVDKLDYNTKLDGAYFETGLIAPDRSILGKFNRYIANYRQLPTSTDIEISYKDNQNENWIDLGCVNDTQRRLLYKELEVEASSMKLKVEFTTSGNTAPEMESLYTFLV